MAVKWYWEKIGQVKFNDGWNKARWVDLFLGQNCHSVLLKKTTNKQYEFVYFINDKEHIRNYIKDCNKGELNLFEEIKINGYYLERVKELLPLVKIGTKIHIYYKEPKKTKK